MDNLFKKIETELNNLSFKEKEEILEKLRKDIDGIDSKIVDLLSERTFRSVMIGRVKRSLGQPTYNPEREKEISNRIAGFAKKPLTYEALKRIYERILDESRTVQKLEFPEGNISVMKNDKTKTSLNNLLSKKQFLVVAIFFAALVGLFYYTFFTPNYYDKKPPVIFEIKKGEPLSEIINNLYNEGIIQNKFNMRAAVFVSGADKRLRAARYDIPNGLSYLDLVDLFVNGKADFQKEVYIRDGLSIKWLAYTIQKEALIDSASFVDIANDSGFIDSLGINAKSLQGYLMPGTYEFYERSPAMEVIGKMYDRFKNFMVDSLKQQAKKIGYSIHDVLTLASIVKGETNRANEMPAIAEVYYNRLKIGMPLQADPTVQFAQPDGWKRLNYHDLRIDSPYNTYRYKGLPPGPINNPGKEAILSALYPDTNKYLYFVADGKGGHNFSKNYSQHLREVAKYRRWLKAQKKK